MKIPISVRPSSKKKPINKLRAAISKTKKECNYKIRRKVFSAFPIFLLSILPGGTIFGKKKKNLIKNTALFKKL